MSCSWTSTLLGFPIIFLFLFFLVMPRSLQDVSSLTGDWTGTTAVKAPRVFTTGPPGNSLPNLFFWTPWELKFNLDPEPRSTPVGFPNWQRVRTTFQNWKWNKILETLDPHHLVFLFPIDFSKGNWPHMLLILLLKNHQGTVLLELFDGAFNLFRWTLWCPFS